ncbi:unnamed protein product, partial [Porites evermanni]
VGGVHLITDVSGNSKKPTLYATALMAHLLTDEEMKDGSVEPKESTRKIALVQAKSFLSVLIKALPFLFFLIYRIWQELRTSMNRKCLDKLKVFRRAAPNPM